MRSKMTYSTSRISPATLSSATGKALVKPCALRTKTCSSFSYGTNQEEETERPDYNLLRLAPVDMRISKALHPKGSTIFQRVAPGSQQKTKEICHVYYMRLRSGLTIRKETCYFEKEPTESYSLKSGRKRERKFFAYSQNAVKRSLFKTCSFQESAESPDRESIQEACASLSTYNDQCVSFKVLENGRYVINVEDSGKDQEKDKMLLRYYESPRSSNESGDGVDGKLLMVNMSPIKDKDIRLHANDKNHSVKLEKCQSPLPEEVFFVLHKKSSDYVSFECKNQRGTYIGVKDNQLALVEEKNNESENIMFKISKV